MSSMYVIIFAILALATQVKCRVKPGADLTKTDFGPDSPWLVRPASHHVQGKDNHAHLSGVPFTMKRDVDHGETEYRVYHDDTVAMETVMTRLGETALYFRTVTDGRKVMKLLYAGRRGLVECDIQRNMLDVDEFLAKFLASKSSFVGHRRRVGDRIDVSSILGNTELFGKNATFRLTENDVLGEPYTTLVDMEQLRDECVQLHRRIKHKLRAGGVDVNSYRKVQTPEDREVSREFIPRRVKRTKRGTSKTRTKRGLLLPDTRWCGAGSDTEDYGQLDLNGRDTDRCCREHDHCEYYINAMSWGYNMFNARLYTISHCYCDEVFRTCLKTTGNDQATMVGNVYFTLLGMKCFEFEEKEVCVERSWWGWCQRTETQIVAEIKGSLTWS